MLKIRAEQYAAFQPVAEADFASRIAQHLRKDHASTIVRGPAGLTLTSRMSDGQLSALVQNGIARARSHGINWESSITAFVVLMFKAAPNFDEHPEIKALLIAGDKPADERFALLLQKTSAAAWTEVKERYDAAAWISEGRGAAA
ncbi:MAG: hypothetical protein ABR555_10060 [Pyrinomonadaceae bacterium]